MESNYRNDFSLKMLKEQAGDRFLSKQYESVIALADIILLFDQDNFDVLVMRAMSLENLGFILDAIDDYNSAINLHPTDANVYGLCGVCYNLLGDFQNSIKYLETAVKGGMKFYNATLYSITMFSPDIRKGLTEIRNTPENRKRRTDKDFTIKNEAINLGTINNNLKEFHADLKNILKSDPENVEVRKIVSHFVVYFEEN